LREQSDQIKAERKTIMKNRDEIESLADSLTAAVTHDFETALQRNGILVQETEKNRSQIGGLGRAGEAEDPEEVLRNLTERTRKRLKEINSRPSARISFAAMGGARVLGAAQFLERQEKIRMEKLLQGKALGAAGTAG